MFVSPHNVLTDFSDACEFTGGDPNSGICNEGTCEDARGESDLQNTLNKYAKYVNLLCVLPLPFTATPRSLSLEPSSGPFVRRVVFPIGDGF